MEVISKERLRIINCRNSLNNSLECVVQILIDKGDPVTLEIATAFLADFREFNSCIMEILDKVAKQ